MMSVNSNLWQFAPITCENEIARSRRYHKLEMSHFAINRQYPEFEISNFAINRRYPEFEMSYFAIFASKVPRFREIKIVP